MNEIICENLSCSRSSGNSSNSGILRNFSAFFHASEVTGFCGPEGCGKRLALNIIGLIEKADSGLLSILGHEVLDFSDEDAAIFRNEMFGFLFGHPCLLPSFTVAENVAMPLFRICGGEAPEARNRTLEVLEFVGIAGLEMLPAGKLDLALRWRAAFARALVHQPRILIAISPPAPDLLPLARRAADELGVTVLWAGKRDELLACANSIIEMRDGCAIPLKI